MERKKFNPRLKIGAAVIITLLMFSILVPLLSPYEAAKQNYKLSLKPPNLSHPFGTDLLGRDLFVRVAASTRISLLVGLLAVTVAFGVGLPLGAVAGYFGGWLDALIMRLADVFLALPMVLGALLAMVVFGSSLTGILMVIGILGWAYIARLSRSTVISVKQNDYILAARALGAGHVRLLTRHIVPNAVSPVLVFAVLNIGTAILAESVLSFLGAGLKPPNVSWGYLLAESAGRFEVAPWLAYFPGTVLTLAVFGFTMIGEGLRATLNPRENDF